jgi:diguanylate cyclase (GGDEF)-like protein
MSLFGRHPIVPALLFGVCFGLSQGALTFAAVPQNSTAIWPTSGLALAAVMILGARIWPAVAAGVFTAHVVATRDPLTALTVGVATALEAVLGAALIQRSAGGADVFRTPWTVFRFAAIVVVTCAIGGALVTIGLTLSSHADWGAWHYTWMTTWLSHVTGTLVVAPVVMLWTQTPMDRLRLFEIVEAAGLLALLVVVSFVVFNGLFPYEVKTYPLEFLCVPLLLWAAFRFGRREMTAVILILSVIAVRGTLRKFGPFAQATPQESLVLLQAYISVMSLMGLVLVAVVAEHKKAEAQLHHLATTDPLTGLANYRHLIDALRIEISRSTRTGRPFAVLFLDMDGLKRINDQHGHLVGSRAICRVADTLRRCCRTPDTPARFGGDEFAVILPETSKEGAQRVLDRINERLARDMTKPAVSVSAGLAVYPNDGDTPTLLLRAADDILYEAKTTKPSGDRVSGRSGAASGDRAIG